MIRYRQRKLHMLLWILGVFSLCLALVSFIGGGGREKLPKEAISSFDDAWIVEDAVNGDSIFHAPGKVSVAAGETVVLSNRLPDVIPENAVFMFQTSFQHFKVTIAGNVICEYQQDTNHTVGQEPFPGYYMISVPTGYAGNKISVELTSGYSSYAGKIGELKYGSRGDVILSLLKEQLGGAFGGGVLLVSALLLFLIKASMGSYGRRQYEFTYVSIIMGLFGLFLLLDNKLLLLLLDGTQGIWVSRLLVLMLLPFFYLLYLYSIADKKQIARFLNYGLILLVLNYLAAIVLVIFGMTDVVVYGNIAIGVILFILVFLTFILMVGASNYERMDLTYLGISNIVFFMFLIIKTAMGYSSNLAPYGDLVFSIGIFVWCLLLLFQVMSRLADTLRGEQLINRQSLAEYKQQTLENLKPDALFGGLHTLLEMMKRQEPEAPHYLVQISNYLRGRLNMLRYDRDALIPFDEELLHILGGLELMMYKNANFSYETEIKVTDFQVPAFAIEAFVENAMTHGAGDAGHPTLISIKTYETQRDYAVQIIDTGKGFDTDKVKSKKEYGIAYAAKQLSELLDASVDVRSREGKGTVVTVKLPKNREEK